MQSSANTIRFESITQDTQLKARKRVSHPRAFTASLHSNAYTRYTEIFRLKTGNKKNFQLLVSKKPIHATTTMVKEDNCRLQLSGGDVSTLFPVKTPKSSRQNGLMAKRHVCQEA